MRAIFVVKPPRKAYSLTSSAFLESGTPCPFLLFAPVFRGSLMLKFQKILDKSRIGVYNHIVRSYSRTADQKCVDGCGFPPHAESAFTESCRLVQGSKASACDPPVADSPNPRCTYGRHGDTGVWLPPVIQEILRLYGFPPLKGSALMDVQRLIWLIFMPSYRSDKGDFLIAAPLHPTKNCRTAGGVFLCLH